MAKKQPLFRGTWGIHLNEFVVAVFNYFSLQSPLLFYGATEQQTATGAYYYRRHGT